ncbi:MAG: class I SAM-dependent methyltransferase [Gaiellaceae bacterium]
MDTDQLRERVAGFPHWHYEFDLQGIRTPITNPEFANRHRERKRYLFDPLVRLCGGSLEGKRVLDLGCNAGFWSLAALDAGADFVLGVEGRQMYIDQAELVFEAKGVDRARYRFLVGDLFGLDVDDGASFDVVLCLGLLYHVSKPMSLFERISSCNTDILLVDTTLSLLPGAHLRVIEEKPEDRLAAVDHVIAFVPTRQAVAKLAREVGYSVAMLRPRFASWEGAGDYRIGSRRAFVCSKETPLGGLDAEPIRVGPLDYAALVGHSALREAGRLRRSLKERALNFGPSRGLPPRR